MNNATTATMAHDLGACKPAGHGPRVGGLRLLFQLMFWSIVSLQAAGLPFALHAARAAVETAAVETPSLVVNSTADNKINDGVTTLREAIAYARTLGGSPHITFDATVFATPQVITLNGTPLDIDVSMVIDGPGADKLTLDGNNASRIFELVITDVTINGITLTRGKSMSSLNGGAIKTDRTTLTLNDCVFSGNNASNPDGGINQGGRFTAPACSSRLPC